MSSKNSAGAATLSGLASQLLTGVFKTTTEKQSSSSATEAWSSDVRAAMQPAATHLTGRLAEQTAKLDDWMQLPLSKFPFVRTVLEHSGVLNRATTLTHVMLELCPAFAADLEQVDIAIGPGDELVSKWTKQFVAGENPVGPDVLTSVVGTAPFEIHVVETVLKSRPDDRGDHHVDIANGLLLCMAESTTVKFICPDQEASLLVSGFDLAEDVAAAVRENRGELDLVTLEDHVSFRLCKDAPDEQTWNALRYIDGLCGTLFCHGVTERRLWQIITPEEIGAARL